jgi:tRNA-2-methylthio-N6-dimethylallyladenosine synthase
VFASGKIEAIGCQVQSGSDRLLKLMGRPYTAGAWRETMLKINRKFPHIRLSTHFLVGFPGETEEDFKATLKILDFPIFIDTVGIFKFSPRPSVYASKMPDQVPEEVKKLRCTRLFRRYLLMFSINMAVNNMRYLRQPTST